MSAHPELLHKKVALVTGASSGIGEATAKLLVKLGVHVIGFARREERLRSIAKSLEGAKGTFDPFPGDIRNESSILDVFKYAEARYKGIDILINNAGIIYGDSIRDSSVARFRDMLDTNLLGAAIATKEAIKSMRKKSGCGHIININSVGGLNALLVPLDVGVYHSSKYGLHALTEDTRREMAQANIKIKVTGIYPGKVGKTEMFINGGIPEALIAPLPEVEPQDIADNIVYALTRPDNVQVSQLIVEPLNARYT